MRIFKNLFTGGLIALFLAITSVNAAEYVAQGDLTTNTGIVAADTMPFDDVGAGTTDKTTVADIFASAANIGASTIVTVGPLDSGSITSNFGTINNGASDITTTGDITGGTHAATTDTSTGDNASMGWTAAEGLILTGQGSTNDFTIKNDADALVASILTGTTNFDVVGTSTASIFAPDGDTNAGLAAAVGFNSTDGLVLTGQGSTNDVTIKNDADAEVIRIPTGTTGVVFAGTTDVSSGTVTGPSGTWDSGGVDIATTDTYAIAGTNVIDNATTLSSGMVTSSLTAVDALASGTIATGFGAIDNGVSPITSGGIWSIDVDGSALNTAGSMNYGAGPADAGTWWDGTDRVDTSTGGQIYGIAEAQSYDWFEGPTNSMRLDHSATVSDTALMLYNSVDATLVRVTTGVNDSGGTGFRALVIPNI